MDWVYALEVAAGAAAVSGIAWLAFWPERDTRRLADTLPRGRTGGGEREDRPEETHSRALALSSVEGPMLPLAKVTYDERRFVSGSADEYLREAEDPFPVERAGPNERVAVWDPDMDRCTTCGHVIGSSNTVNGVPFTLCEDHIFGITSEDRPGGATTTTGSARPCGKYRTTIALDYDQWEQASAEAREAMLRLAYDTPTTMPEDEEIRAWYERRLLR